MERTLISSLVSAAMVTGVWIATPSIGRTESLANTQGNNAHRREELAAPVTGKVAVEPTSNSVMAQLFYPPASGPQAFRVLGQGQVSVPADIARIELQLSRNSPSDIPAETTALFSGNKPSQPPVAVTPPKPQPEEIPLTKESLKPVVDALVAIGVPAQEIQVQANAASSLLGEDSAKVLVKLEKPTRERVQQVVNVGTDAATNKTQLFVNSVNVRYAVKDCQSLARTAYQAAVNDARNRAEAIASGMGVRLANVPSVSELPIYDLFVPLCSEEADLPSFLPFASTASPYDPEAPAQVQLRRDIFVTYPIK
ncbi:MAG: SIMPL domain-containing protein [Aphanothece sp. CMT-3BRIN-NPC111]|nr:SIMPL domain-containing protein [Aphanothece sp. CMT-3BRIN-NPC111]